MDEKRYLISDAAKVVQAEPQVLRYWEEELELPIQRTELGHRYYTEEDIQTFQNIKELKERGFQLKAIKVLLPELKKRKADSSAEIIDLEQKLAEQEKEKAESEGNITVFPLNPDLDRFQQFETIMTSLFRQFQTALSQKACPVDDGMHKDIVAQTHVSHLFPGEYPFCGHGGVVLHDPFSLLANFVVNIVADEHIDCVRSGDEFF